jgi:primosomal replication protein N''
MSKVTSLQKIDGIIEELSSTAKFLDNSNSKLKAHNLLKHTPLFSVDLFSTSSDLFYDYIEEIKDNSAQLKRLIGTQNNVLAEYQIESLEKKISSLLNAFNSNQSIHNEAQHRLNAYKSRQLKKSAKAIIQPSENLYQTLAENHEFERRLLQMLTDKENERNMAPARQLTKLSGEVLVLHQRLGRCRQAISKIENDIVNMEKRTLKKY